jgi:hypothetical protein
MRAGTREARMFGRIFSVLVFAALMAAAVVGIAAWRGAL